MPDLQFLDLLRQKLTIGNRRSIHLNVLPGSRLNRLDVNHLSLLTPYLPQDFLQVLLKKPKFSFTLAYQRVEKNIDRLPLEEQQALQQLRKRLNAITYENNDTYLEHGVKPFGFGYPILIKRDPNDSTKVIKAPILIWQLDIQKLSSHTFKWRIKREEDFPVYFNQLLKSFLEQSEQISLHNIPDEYLMDNVVAEDELLDIVNKLLQQLNTDEDYPVISLVDCPGVNTLKNIPIKKAVIRWSGVFGLFKTQKQAIIKDVERLIQLYQAPPNDQLDDYGLKTVIDTPIKTYQQHAFGGIATDPSQQTILQQVGQYPQQIIQGPPGTGKSQSLTALIINALSNNAKVLVVCQKRTALEVLYQNLQAFGLGELATIIEDIAIDRKKVVNSVRQRLEMVKQNHYFDDSRFNSLINEANNLSQAIVEQQLFSNQLIFKSYTWSDLVGLFIKYEQAFSYKYLEAAQELWSSKFDFNEQEYDILLKSIKQAKQLYPKVNTLNHPLTLLKHQWISNKRLSVLQVEIPQLTLQWLQIFTNLQKEVEQLKEEYRFQINFHYQEYYKQQQQATTHLLKKIQDNTALHGNAFTRQSNFQKNVNQFLSLLSTKRKKALEQQSQCHKAYNTLKKQHQLHPYFSFSFMEQEALTSLPFNEIATQLQTYQQMLTAWFTQRNYAIQQFTEQLSTTNIHPHINYKQQLEQFQVDFIVNFQGLKGADFLQKPIASDVSTLQTQEKSIEEIIKVLQNIKQHLSQFIDFYQWQHFYLALSANTKTLLKALINQQTDYHKWMAAFNSWYFYWLLSRNETIYTPNNSQSLTQYSQLLQQINTLQKESIIKNWQKIQERKVRQFNHQQSHLTVQRLYNKRGSKGKKRHSLRKILHTDFELFSNFFPVLLVSPVVCSSIVPLKKGLFNLVIFDEASQLRLEETYTALLRGKVKVVSGDIHQMPPSSYFVSNQQLLLHNDDGYREENESGIASEAIVLNDYTDLLEKESLLEYAEDMNFKRAYLDFHYRSRHPLLIAFSNAAFYSNRLMPIPAQYQYTPIKYIAVNGTYYQQTNSEEVTAVLNILLHDIQAKTNANKELIYPSVGIATFNIYQRNLLLEAIENTKRSDAAAAEKLNQLELAGLFVKNLENIQGDERDIMILSTTYGKRADGSFKQLFGGINQQKGYKLLNVIITRAKYQVYVCTSIPQTNIDTFAQDIQNQQVKGRTFLYAYLAYAKAISTNNMPLANNILQQMSQAQISTDMLQNTTFNSSHTTSIFCQWLMQALRKQLPTSSIVSPFQLAGLSADICLHINENGEQKHIIIETDGAKQANAAVAPTAQLYQQQQFEARGYRFMRVYAYDFWLQAEEALQRLVEEIEEKG